MASSAEPRHAAESVFVADLWTLRELDGVRGSASGDEVGDRDLGRVRAELGRQNHAGGRVERDGGRTT